MNSKPQWKDAPEWANYWAQDRDGTEGWFEYEPKRRPKDAYWLIPDSGRFVKVSPVNPNWRETLEKRNDQQD